MRQGLLLTALFLWVLPAAQAAIPSAERAALTALYNQTAGAGWTNNTGWSNPSTGANGSTPGQECTWYGVTCDAGGNHVTELYLQVNGTTGNNLVGTLPSLSALTSLQSFVAGRNQLAGAIPSLGALTSLHQFIVDYNLLTGSLPALTGLTSLQAFFADHNELTGTIPPLTGLTALQAFFVNDNLLSGPIPSVTGLSSLQAFVVSNNQLTGALPPLTGLTALQFFNASQNLLTGSIPSLAGLAALQYFDAHSNGLTGTLPALSGLTALQSFNVRSNDLSGSIPAFGALPALQYFDVGINQLSGSVPSLGTLTSLQSFYVFLNRLTGPMALPPSPSALLPAGSNLCGNKLQSTGNAAADLAWDVASGSAPVDGRPGWLTCQSLVFGAQVVGTTSAEQIVTIAASADSGSITITGITITGDFAQHNDCTVVVPGTHCTIHVTFTPTAAGLRTGSIIVSGFAGSETPIVQAFPIEGTGIAAPAPQSNVPIPSLSDLGLLALAALMAAGGMIAARRRTARH